MSKPVNITLNVLASTLLGITNPQQFQIDNCCTFSDDNQDPSITGQGIEQFLSNVYINQNVTWIGTAPDPGYTVSIDSIVYTGNLNFFTAGIINGNGGRSANVMALVKNDQSLIGKLDVYKINFSVYSPGYATCTSYSIDPKLQGNG